MYRYLNYSKLLILITLLSFVVSAQQVPSKTYYCRARQHQDGDYLVSCADAGTWNIGSVWPAVWGTEPKDFDRYPAEALGVKLTPLPVKKDQVAALHAAPKLSLLPKLRNPNEDSSVDSVTVPPSAIAVVIERDLAEAIWRAGVDRSPETLNPTRAALIRSLTNSESPQVAKERNQKRCERRDGYGNGPTHECLRKLVILTLEKSVVTEWLKVLNGSGRLTSDSRQAIYKAFYENGFRK